MACPYFREKYYECTTGKYPYPFVRYAKHDTCRGNNSSNIKRCYYFAGNNTYNNLYYKHSHSESWHRCYKCNEMISDSSFYCPVCGEQQD